IDAVFYALTQPNASFKFSPAFEAPEQTINQPWTSVVLEGLRRMDEGVMPRTPSVIKSDDEHEGEREQTAVATAATVSKTSPAHPKVVKTVPRDDVKAFGVLLSGSNSESFSRRRWNPAFVVAAVVVVIAAVGIPWGWYTHKRSVQMSNEVNAATPQI